MLKALILLAILLAAAVFIVFQIIVPLFSSKIPVMWSFRKVKPPVTDLDYLEKNVDVAIENFDKAADDVTAVSEKVSNITEKLDSIKQKIK
jgi:hypothetical protein